MTIKRRENSQQTHSVFTIETFKMKIFVLVLLAVAVSAEIDYSAPEWNIDWSKAVSVEELPGFWDNRDLPKPVITSNYRNRRIIGGEEVRHGDHPYQASILVQFSYGTGLCGASLIHARTLLTAAHCITGSTSTIVILGAHNRVTIEPQQQRQTVHLTGYRVHARYNPQFLNNDIATLVPPTEWTTSTFIQSIRLPSDHLTETFAGFRGTSTGWGRTINDGVMSDVMRRAVSNIITNAVCSQYYGFTTANAGVICAETSESNQGICQGDNGGALTVNEPQFGGLVQVGVASFVGFSGICVNGVPALFERVTFHNTWINQNLA